jgi:4'-phosphopantetheinyl transferase
MAPDQAGVPTAPVLLLIDREDGATRARQATLAELLSEEERLRWRRYRRGEDRERSLLARGVLRLVLGRWLGHDPSTLRFASGPHGKPFLADGAGRPWPGAPRFNVSHSGRFVLLGFHGDKEVGVDVEQVRAPLDWEPIARRCFPRHALEAIKAMPAREQPLAFHRHWCRLEAELKARGVGLVGREELSGSTEGGGADEGTGMGQRVAPSLRVWEVALPSAHVGAAALLDGGAV